MNFLSKRPGSNTGFGYRPMLLFIILFVLISVQNPEALAQEVQRISFNQAVSIALEQNVNIRRGENNLQLQESSVTQAKANFLPSLSASSGGSRRYGLTFDQTVGKLVTQSSGSVNASLSSSINLFNGFADVASLEQARRTLESQEYDFARTRQTIVFNVISNYLSVVNNLENVGIRKDNLEAQQLLLNQIQEFVNAGTRAVSDLYTQQATVAAAEAQVLTAESTYQVSRTRLIQTLQLDPLGEYEFFAPDPEDIPLTVQEYNSQNLIRSAFESRADLRAQEAAIDASVQGIRIARAGYLPRLNFSGGYGTSYSDQQDTPFWDQLDQHQSKSLSLNLSIPIFNKLSTKTAVESRLVQHANALLDLEALQQSVALDVRQAYYDYQTSVKQLDVTSKQLRAAEQALEVEQERYNVGASTLVELTQSRSTFVSASSQRVQAIFQFHFTQRLLEYYQGVLDPAQSLF